MMFFCLICYICLSSISISCETDFALIKGLIEDFNKKFRFACATIFNANNLTFQQSRQTFLIYQNLAKSKLPLTKVTTFNQKSKVDEDCVPTLFLVFGWQTDSKYHLKKLLDKKETTMTGSVWLVFLKGNDKTEEYLNGVSVSFDAENFITVKLNQDEDFVLEKCYRVADNYPLRISKFGLWNKKSNLMLNSSGEALYRTRNDLEGFPIRATSIVVPPLCTILKTSSGDLKIGGYFGLVYYALAERLNFTAVIKPAISNFTGTPDEDGKWNGILGMMQRDELDLSAGPHAFDRTVLVVANFLRPLFLTSFQIFFKQEGNVLSWAAIFRPFAYDVWISIAVWILVTSLLMNLFYRIECFYGNESRLFRNEYSALNSFFVFLKALCLQGHPLIPHSSSCRITFLTAYYFSTIIITAYSATLVARITNKEPYRPFDSMETFLQDGSYKLIAIGPSFDYLYFSEAQDPLRKGIYTKCMIPAPESKEVHSDDDGFAIICSKNKYAFFISHDIPEIKARKISEDISRKCNILHLTRTLDKITITIVFTNRLPFNRLFDYELLKMNHAGILNKLRNEAWPLKKFKSNRRSAFFNEVAVEQVATVHCILWIGIFLSIIILILELFYYNKIDRKSASVRKDVYQRKRYQFNYYIWRNVLPAQRFTISPPY